MNREEIQEKIYRINCLTEETDSIYHQAAVQFGLSDSSLLIFYMLYTNKGQCRLSDLYMVSGTSKQTVNSAIRKMEKEGMVYLEMYDGKSKMVYLTEKENHTRRKQQENYTRRNARLSGVDAGRD